MGRYKKIAIVGISGSGKSTLARFLSQSMELPVFHVDTILWKGNWKSAPKDNYLLEHRAAVEHQTWIIEGYIDKEMSDRLRKADLVLYLDYSGARCFFRVLYRLWKHHKISRPELPTEAVDYFDPKVFLRVLTRSQRKEIAEAIEAGEPARVIHFYSPDALDNFIASEFGPMTASRWVGGQFARAESSSKIGGSENPAILKQEIDK